MGPIVRCQWSYYSVGLMYGFFDYTDIVDEVFRHVHELDLPVRHGGPSSD